MNELHLIGYTADLEHLVLDHRLDGPGAYRVAVDADLLSAVEQVWQLRGEPPLRPAPTADPSAADPGAAVDDAGVAAPAGTDATGTDATGTDEPGTDATATDAPASSATDGPRRVRIARPSSTSHEPPGDDPAAPPAASHAELATADADADDTVTVDDAVGGHPAESMLDGEAEIDGAVTEEDATSAVTPAPPRSRLSPAEIQARLRSGRSIAAVAKEAGADLAWIEKWDVPIRAERTQVIQQARAGRITRARLGPSALPMGESVRANLADKGVQPDEADWRAARRKDGRWKVTVAYVTRGKRRTATWRWDPQARELAAQNDLARELGHVKTVRPSPAPTASGVARGRAVATADDTPGADADAGRAPEADHDAAESSGRGSAATGRSTATTADATQTAARKPAAKQSTAKKASAKKASAKKASARKASARKATAKKSSAKKSSTKKASARKSSARRSTAGDAGATQRAATNGVAERAASRASTTTGAQRPEAVLPAPLAQRQASAAVRRAAARRSAQRRARES